MIQFQETLSLRELLFNRSYNKRVIPASNLSKNRLARWKYLVGENVASYFDRRISWSRIPSNYEDYLEPDKLVLDKKIDSETWLYWYKKFQNNYQRSDYKTSDKKIPFVEVSDIFADFILSSISWPPFITQNVQFQLRRQLSSTISRFCSQSLVEYLDITGEAYENFTQHFFRMYSSKFFSIYPTLTRMLFTRVSQNVEFLNSFTGYLIRDVSKLKNLFAHSVTDFEIYSLTISELETHNGGKSVIFVDSSFGKFVFKPRSLKSDSAYYSFLKYLNKNSDLNFYVPKLLSLENRGYVEYIEHKGCELIQQVEMYYRRLGALTALHYVLSSTDLHSENLIAFGEYPVFIDLETLITPEVLSNTSPMNALSSLLDKKYGNSVFKSGILPHWLLDTDTSVYDNSSMGMGVNGYKHMKIHWKNLGESKIAFEYQEDSSVVENHKVYLNGTLQNPTNYEKVFEEAFVYLYKFIQSKRNSSIFKNKLLEFKDIPQRFVFRATKVYTILLDFLNHPEYMKNGVDRSIEYECLAQGLVAASDKKHKHWKLFESELSQIENLDVPYFTYKSNSKYVSSYTNKDKTLVFKKTAYAHLKENIAILSNSDLDFQLKLIRSSFNTFSSSTLTRTLSTTSNKVLSYSQIISDIYESIRSQMIEHDDRITWMSYVSNVISHTYGYKPVGYDLANGNLGIALFYAALYKESNNPDLAVYIRKIFNYVSDTFNNEDSAKFIIKSNGLGITTGIGSMIYSSVKLFELTNDSYYLQYAHSILKLIDPTTIDKSEKFDVVSGLAGFLLSLHKLAEVSTTADSHMKNLFINSLRTLLNNLFVKGNFTNQLKINSKPLMGFSHGSSGIVYTLGKISNSKLFEGSLASFISKIIEYEESLYSIKHHNWPDSRDDIDKFDVYGWCNGSTGIGMSRLALLNLDDSPIKAQAVLDTDRSIRNILLNENIYLDTVCCGNFGIMDFLIELRNTQFWNPSLNALLEKKVAKLLTYYSKFGSFNYFSKFKTDEINVGFFQGCSGIGYQLLRYQHPDILKSILLFN